MAYERKAATWHFRRERKGSLSVLFLIQMMLPFFASFATLRETCFFLRLNLIL
jgi:hypothetical protein